MEYSILMPGAVVEEGATVRYAIVAENAVIAKDAEVGGSPADGDVDKWGVAVGAEGVRIGRGAKLAAKEMADEDLPDVKSVSYTHLQKPAKKQSPKRVKRRSPRPAPRQ